MSRDRAPHVAQGTWRSGHLYIWGWNGESPASTAWMYSGFGRASRHDERTWHDTPISYGELTRFQLELPSGGRRPVPAVKLTPHAAAVFLSELPDGPQLSASIAWFGALTHLAVRLVGAGRVAPIVEQQGPFQVARWKPVITERHREQLQHAASIAPPVCRNGSGASTVEILEHLVDGVARTVLSTAGWRPEVGRRRNPDIQSLRGVFQALAKPDPTVRAGSDEFDRALADLDDRLERHRLRLDGQPVVVGRLRLDIPDDAGDPWVVGLELVDDTDHSRWCTALDVWSQSARALDLAGDTRHLPALNNELQRVIDLVAPEVIHLESFGDGTEPTTVELELDDAEDFLTIAPAQLDALQIDLIGPEHLITTKVRVRGSATEQPADDRASRFGKEALVAWEAVIDDTPISAAELERAADLGATLLRTGHRWVRIDPDSLRRARKVLSEQVETSSTVGAAELLRLANHDDRDADVAIELVLDEAHDADEASGGDDTIDTGADRGWIAALLAGLPDERIEEVHESDAFVGELRHYQRRGLGWMQFLANVGLGGILADDMGLGKTATTLAHLVERPGPHLVVCPLSVVHNWENEARRFTPTMRSVVHHGASRQVGGPALFGLADADIVITTYGLLPRDLDTLAEIDWTTVVLDEAQNIKNANTKAAKAVRRLDAAQKMALTGTPVENRLLELWAILDAVNPGLLGTRQRFRDEFASPIERNSKPEVTAEVAERLRRLTGPFVLRRTKADRTLLPDLPDKIEQIAYASLTKEQATLYQQVVDQLLVDAKDLQGMQRRGRVLASLMRLKQICNHPAHALKDGSRLAGRSGKLNRFDELIETILDIDERGLVFTQFREMGDLLQRHLSERFGLDVDFLHGGVSKSRRDRMVDEFQTTDRSPLLLVSLKAGGTGLNLTAASQVIHYDRWWNPAVEDQATDRAWRLGQQSTVNVHKLVCRGTVEERIGEVIDDKRAIADAAVGTGEGWISELDTSELARLVTLGETDG